MIGHYAGSARESPHRPLISTCYGCNRAAVLFAYLHRCTPGALSFNRVSEISAAGHKNRKDRTLSKDEIAHYPKIAVVPSETIRLTAEIDNVIDKHSKAH